MSARRENSRKASGSMHVLPLARSSNPIGQAQIGPLGAGLLRQRWLQPLSLCEHALVPKTETALLVQPYLIPIFSQIT